MSSKEQAFVDIISGRRRGIAAGLTRGLLRAAEIPYSFGSAWKNRRFDRDPSHAEKVGVPVISIGNLTTGGTGKTPMVTSVCRYLRERDLRVCILSRGYGAQQGSVNDEALELELRLPDVPHLQNPDRIESARVAVNELDSQILVLDDAFQHRRIHRDLDIVLIDAANPFGFGHQLPRGLLRESPRGLRRADVVMITRSDMVSRQRADEIGARVTGYNPAVVLCESNHQPQQFVRSDGSTKSIESLAGSNVLAFCGIGNPDGFRHSLETCGVKIEDFKAFPDHHAYSRETIREIIDWTTSQSNASAIVCTQKDLVKIGVNELGGKELFALSIGLQITSSEQELWQAVDSVAEAASTPNQ